MTDSEDKMRIVLERLAPETILRDRKKMEEQVLEIQALYNAELDALELERRRSGAHSAVKFSAQDPSLYQPAPDSPNSTSVAIAREFLVNDMKEEVIHRIDPLYLYRIGLDEERRARIIELIYDDSNTLKMSTETTLLAISNLERYFSSVSDTSTEEIAALRFAAAYLALKANHVGYITTLTFLCISNVRFVISESVVNKLVSAELKMFDALGAEVFVPTVSDFYNKYIQLSAPLKADYSTVHALCEFLTHLSTLQSKFLKFPLSLRASAIYFYSLVIDGAAYSTDMRTEVMDITRYSLGDIKQCVLDIYELHQNSFSLLRKYPLFNRYLKRDYAVVSVNPPATIPPDLFSI